MSHCNEQRKQCSRSIPSKEPGVKVFRLYLFSRKVNDNTNHRIMKDDALNFGCLFLSRKPLGLSPWSMGCSGSILVMRVKLELSSPYALGVDRHQLTRVSNKMPQMSRVAPASLTFVFFFLAPGSLTIQHSWAIKAIRSIPQHKPKDKNLKENPKFE
jgi:hypothetical protein